MRSCICRHNGVKILGGKKSLEIKKFNGEYHDWQRFYDEYEATINSNSTLSSIEKFNYL
ncbi:hypothetical protein T03_8419 [Trichinella britovi]|uniref:Uncharacterized protein n=1 Tax=Trichinella britovi TaxID=45882 RepID=A0A0V1AIU9_TRIBR|nr:hypothetical protein T03_8419 [Trichinella britovi]